MLVPELKISDTVRINQIAASLVAARKDRNPNRFRSFIEDSLKARAKLPVIARITDELYLTQGELNTSFFRAGVASLQKANTDTAKTQQERYFNQAQSEFEQALFYNPSDLDAKHDLAFVFYRKGGPGSDIRAMNLYEEIIKASILTLTDTILSAELGDSLVTLISGDVLAKGSIPVPAELSVKIENELVKSGSEMTGLVWLYFPNLNRIKRPVTTLDKKDIFLSSLAPKALENLYLLYGSTQANVATELKQEGKIDEANKKYDEAIVSFKLVLALNPKSRDAITSLAVVFREKGDKEEAFKMLEKLEQLKKGN
jgi:tetratricopeptide (TPR) repeat protein